MNKTIKYNLDFGGFYESIHSYSIESSIANHFDKESFYDISESQMDSIDFNAMQLDYAKQWFQLYYDKVFSHGYFVGIDSPEYYNFETDKIEVEISASKVNQIMMDACSNHELIDYIDTNSQSYDGFHSYYVGFTNVCKNPSVFMNYYTRYLSEMHQDDIEYFFESIYVHPRMSYEFKAYNEEEVA